MLVDVGDASVCVSKPLGACVLVWCKHPQGLIRGRSPCVSVCESVCNVCESLTHACAIAQAHESHESAHASRHVGVCVCMYVIS